MEYPTGYSDKPIDFGRASQAMLHSALQMKLADVRKQEGDLSETQKFMIKAMDINTLPTMSVEMQNRFQKDISAHRDNVLKIVKDAPGNVPSIQDKVKIEGDAVALQNRMKHDIGNLAQLHKLQDIAINPTHSEYVDQPRAQVQWGKLSDAVMKGNTEVDGKSVDGLLSTFALDHYKAPTEAQILDKALTPALKRMGESSDIVKENGHWVTRDYRNIGQLSDAIDKAYSTDPNLGATIAKINPVDGTPIKDAQGNYVPDPIKKAAKIKQGVNDYMKLKESAHVPSKGRGTSTDTATVDSGYTSFGSGQYTNAVKAGSTTGVPERSIKGATLDDGTEVTDENPRQYNTIAASLKDGKPVINIVIKGGNKERAGKPLFMSNGYEYDESIISKVYADVAKEKAIADYGKDFKVQGSGIAVKKGDSYELQYTAIKPATSPWGGKKTPEEKKTVSFPLEAAKDANKQTWATIPWNNFNKGLLAKADLHKKMDGTDKTVEQYFDEISKGHGSQPKSEKQSDKPKSVKIDDDFSQYIVKKK